MKRFCVTRCEWNKAKAFGFEGGLIGHGRTQTFLELNKAYSEWEVQLSP